MSLRALKKSNENYQDKEFWKPIKGYEGFYEVSDLGRVRSLPREVKGKGNTTQMRDGFILKHDASGRYPRVTLFKENKRFRESVHRLVAIAYVENPSNKPEVNHINGNSYDNRPENLEWVTSSENQQHAVDTGLQKTLFGEDAPWSKLTNKQVIEIKESEQDSVTRKKLSKKFNVTYSTIYDIQKGRRWSHLKAGEKRSV